MGWQSIDYIDIGLILCNPSTTRPLNVSSSSLGLVWSPFKLTIPIFEFFNSTLYGVLDLWVGMSLWVFKGLEMRAADGTIMSYPTLAFTLSGVFCVLDLDTKFDLLGEDIKICSTDTLLLVGIEYLGAVGYWA